MIPHSIRRAAPPVTKGVAKEVPVTASTVPPGILVITFTPGAARSGFVL